MRALLLAAGFGTRLRPITNSIPKCMVPILGRPLLEYWLEALELAGVNEIIVNTHYLPEVVNDFVAHSRWNGRITLVYEEELLGTGGTILNNAHLLAEGPFLVAHADNLTRFSVLDFYRTHITRPSKTDVTMMLFRTDKPTESGIVELDGLGIVTKFYEKVANPPSNLANGAVYIFEPSVLEQLRAFNKPNIDLSTEVIPLYLNRINTYINFGYHRDIGDLASLEKARRDFIGSSV